MTRELTEEERNRFAILLMKAVDGELDDSEQQEFERFVATSSWCADEWKKYTKLREAVMSIGLKGPPEEVWEGYWRIIYNRIERGVGWLLFSIGCVILLTYGGFKMVEAVISDPTLGFVVKAGILLLLGGGFVLFVSAARERYFTWKRDKYREVIR